MQGEDAFDAFGDAGARALSGREYLDTDVADKSPYEYFMRVDPDMRDFLGPIERTWDNLTQREMPQRTARIAMVRGAKDENIKEVTVYLEPFPHIRTDGAKDLQGWYSSKNDGALPGQRDRPCETDAILTQPYGGWCTVGCTFSLLAGEMIETPTGPMAIETFRAGDVVWGRSIYGIQPAKVLATSSHVKQEGYIALTIGGVRLLLTADHPVYSLGRGWTAAGSLQIGEELEIRFQRDGQTRENRPCQGAGARESVAVERPTQIGNYAPQNELVCCDASRRDGQARVWTEDAGMESGAGGTCAARAVRLPIVEADGLSYAERTGNQDALGMGNLNGRVVGSAWLSVDIRADGDPTAQRGFVFAGFSIGRRSDYRGQGLLRTEGQSEDRRGEETGLSNQRPHAESAGAIGSARVEAISVIPGAVQVYDIETDTQNFYHRGVLSHNCYINSGARGYRGSGLITVPLNYGEFVRKQLKKMQFAAAGYFSSFTDPFLELEDYYHNSQAGATAFVDAGLPIFFLSRMVYPGWAIDLLRKNPYSYAQKSINTANPETWKKISPGAIPLEDNFEQIRAIRKAGVYVSIQCNPVLPGIMNHDDIELLFERLAEVGTNHVIVKFVEANHPWAGALVDRLRKKFPGAPTDRFAELFTENSCGGQKTIREEYRREGHARYQAKATKLGMTYSLCYEYTKLPSGRFISMGPEFLTSDQCHGHRVPMHVKKGERFEALDVCPTHGCLRCGDTHPDGVPCGSPLMSQANAWKMSDFRRDPYAPLEKKIIPLRTL